MSAHPDKKMSEKSLDNELVKLASKGDMRAFEMLVNRYQQRLANVVAKFIRDRDEIQDVTQEVFIKIFRALANFRGESSFYTWAYRIAVNTAKNHLVAQSRRIQNSDAEPSDPEIQSQSSEASNIETPDRVYARSELEQAVSNAIRSLPEDLRTAIVLREMDGLSYEEIAQEMSCPIGTVRSRIFRARDAIDQALKPLLKKQSLRNAYVR